MDKRKTIGDRGEDIASRFLKNKGVLILKRQYRTKFGEVDIIAKDKDELVFVEVKTRTSLSLGYPEESVTEKKLDHMRAVADAYLRVNNLNNVPYRFDVISIHMKGDDSFEIMHIQDVGYR